MDIIKQVGQMQRYATKQQTKGLTIGFVPTMGALHQGHLALVEKAKKLADVVIVSIFVNPTQFNNPTDLEKYPRTLEADLTLLNPLQVDAVFAPNAATMYPNNLTPKVIVPGITERLEGLQRPGHFDGVAQVITKLFNIIKPNIAVFGQKDLQQFAVIKQLNQGLNFGIELVLHPIVREASGLAMSSRNSRLSPAAKTKAAALYQALLHTKNHLIKTQNATEARQQGLLFLEQNEIKPEYLEIICPDTFKPLDNISNNSEFAICLASIVGGIRLIDNLTGQIVGYHKLCK